MVNYFNCWERIKQCILIQLLSECSEKSRQEVVELIWQEEEAGLSLVFVTTIYTMKLCDVYCIKFE